MHKRRKRLTLMDPQPQTPPRHDVPEWSSYPADHLKTRRRAHLHCIASIIEPTFGHITQ